MAGGKIEHNLADKARQLDELQQRADKFQQFVKGSHKDMMAIGQQFMQFFQQFSQTITGGAPTGASGVAQTEAGRNFARLVNDNVASARASGGGGKSMAEAIVLSERIRDRNMRAAGLGGASGPSLLHGADEIAGANRQLIKEGLYRAAEADEGQAGRDATAEELRGWNRDPERRRRRALVQEYSDRLARQADLKSRLLSKHGASELRDPLASQSLLTTESRARAEALAATGGPTHFRYDVTDIPAAMQLGQKFTAERGALAGRVEALRTAGGPNEDVNRTIATALENMVRRMDASQMRFTDALQSFTRLSADPQVKQDSQEYKTALNELRHSIEDLTNSNQDLSRANKAAGGMGGGGPGGAGDYEARYKRWRPYAAAIGGAISGVAAASSLYLGAGISMDRAALGAERRAIEAQGGIGSALSGMSAAAQDMTDPRNLLMYRADKIFGRQYKYLGTAPTDLHRVAVEEAADQHRISKDELRKGLIGSGATGAAGALALGGLFATGIGAPLAAGLAAGGLFAMKSATEGTIDNLSTNRALELERGGIHGTWLGRLFRSDAPRRADYRLAAAAGEVTGGYLDNFQKLREAELKAKHSNDLMALTEYQSLVDTQEKGAVLVGGYAARREDLLNRLLGTPTRTKHDTAEAYKATSLEESAERGKIAANAAKLHVMERNTPPGLFGVEALLREKRSNEIKAEISAGEKKVEALYGGRASGMYSPVGGGARVTSPYAHRDLPLSPGMHRGLDLVSKTGDLNLYSIGDAKVVDLGHNRYAGNFVAFQTNDGTVHRYNHLAQKARVNLGQKVAAGQVLGTMGSTGRSTGVHLDWRMYSGMAGYQARQALDPTSFLAQLEGGTVPFANATAITGAEAGGYNPLSPMSASAALGMSPSEFMGHMNAVTNVLGSRTRAAGETVNGVASSRSLIGMEAGIEQTSRLIQLGRSGIGSFQDLVGNVAALNRTAGGHDNTQKLEQVMAAAVQAGFDKSRTAQAFFQTTDSLARSMNMTNVSAVAGTLGAAAASMTMSGKADEHSMALAASGMKGYHDHTAQKSGVVGALKAARIFGAGGTIAGGALELLGQSELQLEGMLGELSAGEIRSPALRRLMATQGGDASAVRKLITATQGGSTAAFKGIYGLLGQGDMDSHIKQIADLRASGRQGEADALLTKTQAWAAQAGHMTEGLTPEGGEIAFLRAAGQMGAIDPKVLNEKIAEARDSAVDPAKKARQKYMDYLMGNMRNAATGVSYEQFRADYAGYAATHGPMAISSGAYKGRQITAETFAEAERNPELKAALEATAKGMSGLDFYRGAAMSQESIQADGQLVRLSIESVELLSDKISRIVKTGRADNLNGNTY